LKCNYEGTEQHRSQSLVEHNRHEPHGIVFLSRKDDGKVETQGHDDH
jgi:hypothetical protein